MVDNSTAPEDLRPNPSRCIYLRGEISQDLLDNLTPRILELRAESQAPITAYIDSLGGSTDVANIIYQLLTHEDLNGHSHSLITVVTGTAASAAADFLASGDYALAYPHSRILFHGTRRQMTRPVTTEVATSQAESLKRTNERFALQLARRSIHRFLFQFQLLKGEFSSIREASPESQDLDCLAEVLRNKLSGLSEDLPGIALEKFRRIQDLTDFVRPNENDPVEKEIEEPEAKQRKAEKQSQLLKKIIEFELKRNPDPEWTFDNSFPTLQEDFELLDEFLSRKHLAQLSRLAHIYSDWFLSPEDETAISEQPEESRARGKLVTAAARIHPIWFFFVSICRSLQEGENFLTPIDAFRLGLVDEIIGSSLPSVRVMIQETQKESTPHPPMPEPEQS